MCRKQINVKQSKMIVITNVRTYLTAVRGVANCCFNGRGQEGRSDEEDDERCCNKVERSKVLSHDLQGITFPINPTAIRTPATQLILWSEIIRSSIYISSVL